MTKVPQKIYINNYKHDPERVPDEERFYVVDGRASHSQTNTRALEHEVDIHGIRSGATSGQYERTKLAGGCKLMGAGKLLSRARRCRATMTEPRHLGAGGCCRGRDSAKAGSI